ncbi:hypothetical protein IIM_05358 [Bacillus cereus VD107]|nr:hypothetical protein IIM_05358 [Bacillus cereus VD107]
MNLDKITQGLKQEITKNEPTQMNDESISKYITERNRPIVVATNRTIMRFKKRKEEEEVTSE